MISLDCAREDTSDSYKNFVIPSAVEGQLFIFSYTILEHFFYKKLLLLLRSQKPFRIQSGHTTGSGCRNRLAVHMIGSISGYENTVNIGF